MMLLYFAFAQSVEHMCVWSVYILTYLGLRQLTGIRRAHKDYTYASMKTAKANSCSRRWRQYWSHEEHQLSLICVSSENSLNCFYSTLQRSQL